MFRVFVALDIPQDIKEDIYKLSASLREEGLRTSTPDQMHLTLCFVGEIDEKKLEVLHEALDSMAFTSFPMRVVGGGHFGPENAPKVLWMGIDASHYLKELFEAVRKAVRQAGFELEKKKYRPHITVTRPKGECGENVRKFLERAGHYASREFEVKSFHLYRSKLKPDGAEYEILESYELY